MNLCADQVRNDAQTMSINEMIEKYRCSANTLYRFFKNNNIQYKSKLNEYLKTLPSKEQIIKDYAEIKQVKLLAEKYNIKYHVMRHLLTKYEIKFPMEIMQTNKPDKCDLINNYKKLSHITLLAKEYGVDKSVIQKWFKEYKIKSPSIIANELKPSKDDLVKNYKELGKINLLAKKYNVQRCTIRSWF